MRTPAVVAAMTIVVKSVAPPRVAAEPPLRLPCVSGVKAVGASTGTTRRTADGGKSGTGTSPRLKPRDGAGAGECAVGWSAAATGAAAGAAGSGAAGVAGSDTAGPAGSDAAGCGAVGGSSAAGSGAGAAAGRTVVAWLGVAGAGSAASI